MRQIGTLPTEEQARRFDDYLLTLGVRCRYDPEEGQWAVWIVDEDDVDRAKEELAGFVADPDAERYTQIADEAAQRRRAEQQKHAEAKRNFVDVSRQWRGARSAAPVTKLLIGFSVAVALLTSFGSQRDGVFMKLTINSYRIDGNMMRWQPGLPDIRDGEVWRVVTPIFLHFGPMHILFNMMWLWDLGRMIESRRGTVRFALLVLLIAAASNLAQYFMGVFRETGGPNFGGMSGVVFGLFGYVWMKSRYDRLGGWFMHKNTVVLMLVWFVLCTTGLVGNIANTAHGVGLAVGVIVGYAPVLFRR